MSDAGTGRPNAQASNLFAKISDFGYPQGVTTFSHALIPVILGKHKLTTESTGRARWPELLWVAFSGALPDILAPHIYLADRLKAQSHSLTAFALFSVLVWLLARRIASLRAVLGLAVFAYAAHLVCDMLCGGIPLFLPFSNQITGVYLLPFWLWIVSDVVLLILFYITFRWLPLRRKRLNRDILPS